jgi:hypothetical protein
MILTMAISAGILSIPSEAHSAEFVVYSVYRALDMGNPGEAPQKDFHVNIGSAQGVRVGTTLEVMRRTSTYDLITEKLYKDITYPIARLKVIHAENNAAVARLDKMLPADKTPALMPNAVIVGDLVRQAN